MELGRQHLQKEPVCLPPSAWKQWQGQSKLHLYLYGFWLGSFIEIPLLMDLIEIPLLLSTSFTRKQGTLTPERVTPAHLPASPFPGEACTGRQKHTPPHSTEAGPPWWLWETVRWLWAKYYAKDMPLLKSKQLLPLHESFKLQTPVTGPNINHVDINDNQCAWS